MRLKSVVLLSGLVLITASCSVRSASTSNQSEEKRPITTGKSQEKGDWKSEKIAGFEVWVGSNLVSEEIRTMYLLAEARSFTEQNLKVIFAGLAAEFAEPKALRLTMMSDPDRLKGAMNGPISHTTKLRTLLTRGADANVRDRHGFSALMKAALYGDPAIVDMLMQRGADLNASDENGWTPLSERKKYHWLNCPKSCSAPGRADIAELLIRAGARD
jgi:hypothetical protein